MQHIFLAELSVGLKFSKVLLDVLVKALVTGYFFFFPLNYLLPGGTKCYLPTSSLDLITMLAMKKQESRYPL